MTRTPALDITIPEAVTFIFVEAWPADSPTEGIIWDRTGLDSEDGEWGTQLIDWEGDLDDVKRVLSEHGFSLGDFARADLPEGSELFTEATR